MPDYQYNTMVPLGIEYTGLVTGDPATSLGYRRYDSAGDLLPGEIFHTAGIFEGTTPGTYYINGGIALPVGFSGSIRWFVGNTASTSIADEPIGLVTPTRAQVIPENPDPATVVTIYDVAQLPGGSPVSGRQVIVKVLTAPDNLGSGIGEQVIPYVVSDETGVWSVQLQRGSRVYVRIPEENIEVEFTVTEDPDITEQRLAVAAGIV